MYHYLNSLIFLIFLLVNTSLSILSIRNFICRWWKNNRGNYRNQNNFKVNNNSNNLINSINNSGGTEDYYINYLWILILYIAYYYVFLLTFYKVYIFKN